MPRVPSTCQRLNLLQHAALDIGARMGCALYRVDVRLVVGNLHQSDRVRTRSRHQRQKITPPLGV